MAPHKSQRRAGVSGRYLEVEMPERFLLQFMTEDGSWMDEAIGLRRRFERLEDGSYICSEFSSGLWIRFASGEKQPPKLVGVTPGPGTLGTHGNDPEAQSGHWI